MVTVRGPSQARKCLFSLALEVTYYAWLSEVPSWWSRPGRGWSWTNVDWLRSRFMFYLHRSGHSIMIVLHSRPGDNWHWQLNIWEKLSCLGGLLGKSDYTRFLCNTWSSGNTEADQEWWFSDKNRVGFIFSNRVDAGQYFCWIWFKLLIQNSKDHMVGTQGSDSINPSSICLIFFLFLLSYFTRRRRGTAVTLPELLM
jgi:hypothetical protein